MKLFAKIIINVLVVSLSVLTLYLAMGFIQLDLDPANWGLYVRAYFTLASMINICVVQRALIDLFWNK